MKATLSAGVVGGSIGGLTAAVLLHELGHDVHVFERSAAALEGRGAGIVVLPMTERYFVERQGELGGIDKEIGKEVALTLTNWSYVNREGELIDEAQTNNRFTAWNTLYRALLAELPEDRYHLGHQVSDVEEAAGDDDGMVISFADGGSFSCDLVIGADGMGSTVRGLVSPDTETNYAGYVAWRGTVHESDLPPATAALLEDAMVYQVLEHSHILAYAIPGPDDSVVPGRRSVNFVWYRNASPDEFDELMIDRNGQYRPTTMPPGLLQGHFVRELHTEADRVLAPQLRDLVQLCDDPFIQAIFDVAAERFVHGHIVLIGDAAAVLRPHVAAGTAKAAADAWALHDQLSKLDQPDLLDSVLAEWEQSQLALATTSAERSRRMGESAQVHSTMVPGDPAWRFGLFEPGN